MGDPPSSTASRTLSQAPVIALRGLERRFPVGLGLRRRTVLRGLELEIPRGSTVALVGPNGSGKSTLLRLLAGVDRPSAGELEVLGGDPRERSIRSRLAYLPEDSPFPGELSALAVLELLGSLHGLTRAAVRERGEPLLEAVGLGALRRAPLRSYSRGMLRRFGLAQAFLNDPELLLLDEPTAGLDAPGFGVLESMLDRAREGGATVVMASHVLSDVHERCDRLVLLLEGRLAAQGSSSELLGAEGRTSFEVEGLPADEHTSLERWITEHGGRLVGERPGVRSLSELYGTWSERGEGDGLG